ncbi:GntR family transcriptional regulator [Thermogemmatispora onikobensis]|uniref:GntR family transcriptional regulator n=1 Tax=Thermogemmatispora onikobensis TaxID=732234 RepID=UPI000853C9EF|nr:GntR family transcriptional regulator [Thermogemmatispora onikobensis]
MPTPQQLMPGPTPLYHQLKQILRGGIERGVYRPGDRLPTEQELMQTYGVSRITVRQALNELEDEGLVVRRHGKGTYVAEQRVEQSLVRLTDFVEDMELAGLEPSSRVLAFQREAASRAVASALGLREGEEVMRLDRLRLANGRPMAFDVTWLPMRFGVLLPEEELDRETIYHLLESRYGIPIEAGTFEITAANATPEQAHLLEVPVGAALLLIRRLSCTGGNAPIYIQERYYRPDRVSYRLCLQRRGGAGGRPPTISELRPIFAETVSPSTEAEEDSRATGSVERGEAQHLAEPAEG